MQHTPKPVSTDDKLLARACEIADQDPDVKEIEASENGLRQILELG